MAHQSKKTNEETDLKRAIAHPRRLEILSYLTRKRGSTQAELAEELGLSTSLVAYHLMVLENADLVSDDVDGLGRSADRFLIATPG